MTLATVDAAGRPSARIVLLKEVDERGFAFYTNYESRKAKELAANPRAALVFYWASFDRQVRIEGKVERTTRAESAEYFASRPLGSRLGAWASRQSAPIAGREILEAELAVVEERFAPAKPARLRAVPADPDASAAGGAGPARPPPLPPHPVPVRRGGLDPSAFSRAGPGPAHRRRRGRAACGPRALAGRARRRRPGGGGPLGRPQAATTWRHPLRPLLKPGSLKARLSGGALTGSRGGRGSRTSAAASWWCDRGEELPRLEGARTAGINGSPPPEAQAGGAGSGRSPPGRRPARAPSRHVATTAVARAYARRVEAKGGTVRTGARAVRADAGGRAHGGRLHARLLVNCATQCDRGPASEPGGCAHRPSGASTDLRPEARKLGAADLRSLTRLVPGVHLPVVRSARRSSPWRREVGGSRPARRASIRLSASALAVRHWRRR
jgi:hypothetical protein